MADVLAHAKLTLCSNKVFHRVTPLCFYGSLEGTNQTFVFLLSGWLQGVKCYYSPETLKLHGTWRVCVCACVRVWVQREMKNSRITAQWQSGHAAHSCHTQTHTSFLHEGDPADHGLPHKHTHKHMHACTHRGLSRYKVSGGGIRYVGAGSCYYKMLISELHTNTGKEETRPDRNNTVWGNYMPISYECWGLPNCVNAFVYFLTLSP